MVRRRMSEVSIGLVAALLLAGSIQAQTGFGVIRGTVHDASNAAVPKAKITLRNQQTNIARESAVSGSGIYYFGDIQPGNYELTVEADGFKKWVGTLTLEVGQTAVVDPALEVGSLTSTVEVTSVAPVITLEGMQIADVKDDLRIHQLPLNGRAV